MFTEQIKALQAKEGTINQLIEGYEAAIKVQKEDLTIVRKGLKSMQRLQDQLGGTPSEDEVQDDED